MDDSLSALTFHTRIYLYTAASLQGEFKNTLYTAQHAGQRVCWGFCVFASCMFIRAGVCFCACRLIKRIYWCQMSEVHCSTLLTSNVTNNFFLQLHCSNPFSGSWDGNIITFLWRSAFDKSATCCAECLTELDVSPKPLLALLYSSPLLALQDLCSFRFPLAPNLSLWHIQNVILPLFPSHPHRYCSG